MLVETPLNPLGAAGTDQSLSVASLENEQTRELIRVVIDLPQQRVTFILDAWESSLSGRDQDAGIKVRNEPFNAARPPLRIGSARLLPASIL